MASSVCRALWTLALLLPARAEAQFPWRRRPEPPAAVQPQWTATPTPAVAPPPVQGAAPAAPSATPPPSVPAAARQELTPLQLEDRNRLVKLAREASLAPAATARDAEDRMERWKMVMLIDPADVEARLGYEEARRALDTARAREETARDTRVALERDITEKRDQLRMAERALYARDLEGAGGILDDVLRRHPDDARAGSLMEMLRDARRAEELRRRLVLGAAVLAAGALVLGMWVRRVYRTRHAETRATGDQPPRALVKVVDGAGRGRLVPITHEILRIGAADAVENGDRNDLVVSDADAAVSRYHCAIVRRGRDYLLVDSSLNGTRLNQRRLARGEHHLLRDGDEFVLAESSRLKFLRT